MKLYAHSGHTSYSTYDYVSPVSCRYLGSESFEVRYLKFIDHGFERTNSTESLIKAPLNMHVCFLRV